MSKTPSLKITVVARDAASEKAWAKKLQQTVEGWLDARIGISTDEWDPSTFGQVIFVDGGMEDVDSSLTTLERKGRAVIMIVDENRKPQDSMRFVQEGKADDIVVYPFRSIEVISKLRFAEQIVLWDEVKNLNASFAEIIGRFKDDLALAERLQKSKAPIRFPDVKGFRVTSRYLAGMKAGGDHFDLAEARSGNQLSLILSDSSSYGLSSAMLSILMKVAMKLSVEETRSCEETVGRIREELVTTLSEKDRLSLFYGMISRKDYVLRYLNLGTSAAFYAPPGKEFAALSSQGPSITRAEPGMPSVAQAEVALEPSGRLAIISDGFLDAAGGPQEGLKLLNQFRDREAIDSLNEMVFKVKSAFAEPDDMPAQDCTAILMDVDAKILRRI